MSELRQDPITGRWVIIAPARAARPGNFGASLKQTDGEACPFCSGNEAMTPPEVWAQREAPTEPDRPGWRLRIVPNKYPALTTIGKIPRKSDDFYRSTEAVGIHEVIIESPEHVTHLTALPTAHLIDILRAYRTRLRRLRQDARWRCLLVYKNQGERAGATLEHVHSQLTALTLIPTEIMSEIDGARRYFAIQGRCIYCDIVRREMEAGERLVTETERFVALCPFAPRFGYETWLLPKRHATDFADSSDEDIAGLGEILRDFTVRLDRLSTNPPFNYVIHSLGRDMDTGSHTHWHMKILPQLTRAAGFEWGSGVHMNSVSPEEGARLLRRAPL